MSLSEFVIERVTADIRERIGGVSALADQLARQRLTPDAQACVSGIAEAAGGVLRILDAVADLEGLSTNGLALNPSPLRLRELVDEVHSRWQPAAAMSGVMLLVSYDGDPNACGMGYRLRLMQVFDGFVGEAVAGMRRGSVEASVRTVAKEDGLHLEGRVRGARQLAPAIRDMEARVREVDSRFGLEVALGVMLARQIIDGMGGVLRSESGPGGGETVTFEFVLPASLEIPEPEVHAAERPIHVLVVDDNATNRMVAQALCEMFDCTCESANDGAEAVEVARGGRFDLILMDIKMPVMDGVAATRAIRNLSGPGALVPIIALTANVEPEDTELYRAAGMNGVVEKPMKPEHLLAALQQALGESADAQSAAAA